MTRLRVTSFAVVALAALVAPGARAQTPKPNQPGVCYPIRYKNLRDMPDESRTYEQQKEFEQLQRACADAAVGKPALGQPGASERAAAPASAPERAAPQRPEQSAPQRPEQSAVPAPERTSSEQLPLRHGFWFSGGLGLGSLGCSDCGSRDNGASASVSLGGTLSQHVQLGGGVDVWAREENGVSMSAGTVTALVRVYPSLRSGFFLTGGVGGASVSASATSGGWGLAATTSGAGAMLGLGYDIRVGRSVSLTPYYSAVGMAFDNGDLNFAQLGIAVKVH